MGTPRYHRERLIDEVKKYSVLYDTQHTSHRDNEVRDQCWAKIAETLGIDCDTAKREWKILRDSLRQAIKREKRTAKGEAGRPWRFQKKMQFVVPHMKILRKPRRPWPSSSQNSHAIKPDEDAQSDPDPETQMFDTADTTATTEDALDLFFASLCQSTRRLPRKFQNQIKKQMLEVLLKTEAEFELDQSESKDELYKF